VFGCSPEVFPLADGAAAVAALRGALDASGRYVPPTYTPALVFGKWASGRRAMHKKELSMKDPSTLDQNQRSSLPSIFVALPMA